MVDTSKFKKDRPVKIHWASFWAGSPWMAAMGEHLQQEFAKYPNVTFTYSDGQNKKEKLIADIEDAANKNPDLIIVTAGDAESPRDVVATAVKKGIPVVALQKVINGDEVTRSRPSPSWRR
jgi:ABC-type sugar transport system substrate-binding protein